MQDHRIEKAYSKLKELEMFSDDFETFSNFFYSNLKEDRKDEAIELLLMVIFEFLKSNGIMFPRSNIHYRDIVELKQRRRFCYFLNT